MNFLPPEFIEFISPKCERFTFLQEWLKNSNIPFSILSVGKSNHICVQFPQCSYNPMFKIKTVLVHYDRALSPEGKYLTPGANDNSAAVYQVLNWAKKLLNGSIKNVGSTHNIRIFFTDGEELGSAQEQGSFDFANRFKKFGITNDDVFVFDGCGRGDVLAVSTAGKNCSAPPDFVKHFDSLFERACTLAREASPGKWITIPVPCSDNAGFLACGIPAVALTVLPSEEASTYMRQLQKDEKFAHSVMTNGIAAHGAGFFGLDIEKSTAPLAKLHTADIDPAEILLMSEKLPHTWRMMHTEHDNAASLTPQAFSIMEHFLDFLAANRTMA